MNDSISTVVQLTGDVAMPRLGLGVYRMKPGDETRRAVLWALEAGYRHVDTAKAYHNELDVGRAVAESGLPRHELWITTKLLNADHGYDRTISACHASLERLGLDYLDLYLIHWPVPELRGESWAALEALHEGGLCRTIGVSNYMPQHLDELLEHANVAPAVNQIEFSPFLYQKSLLDLCTARGIVVQAYAPLAVGKRFDHPVLTAVARAVGRSPAQVMLRWALQHGMVVLPKSSRRERIEENARLFDFNLDGAQMERLDGLNENLRTSWDPTKAV